MIAASALVVAVLASYAGIGMLSLTATSPFSGVSSLPGVSAVVSGIGWNPPNIKSVTALGRNAVLLRKPFEIRELESAAERLLAGHEAHSQ